jgi:hypothetical protein
MRVCVFTACNLCRILTVIGKEEFRRIFLFFLFDKLFNFIRAILAFASEIAAKITFLTPEVFANLAGYNLSKMKIEGGF